MTYQELINFIRDELLKIQDANNFLNNTVTSKNQKDACLKINYVIDDINDMLNHIQQVKK